MAVNESLDNTIIESSSRVRGQLRLSDLSSLRLHKVIPYQYALLEMGQNLIITVSPDGLLQPGLLPQARYKQLGTAIRPISSKFIDRPYITTVFETIDDTERRNSFNIKRDLDYLGCDKTVIRKIATGKDIALKRANYYIDEIDDKIALYLNKKLYSMDPEKRPRIHLLDYFNLIKIIPNKIFHLVNIIGGNSSLIMHRRSQRTAMFKSSSPLTRMERLFFWCANIKDGHYEFPFIENDFMGFMKTKTFKERFPLTAKQLQLLELCIKATEILTNSLETEIGCILTEEEYNFLFQIEVLRDSLIFQNDLYIFMNFHSEKLRLVKPDAKYWLNELDRQRFKTFKPKGKDITEVAMPGNKSQKLFFSEKFSKIQKLNLENKLLVKYPHLNLLGAALTPHSLGRLTKNGRKRVKTNLLELYKYFMYVQHKHIISPDEVYWNRELQFLDESLTINILLWQTNCLRILVTFS